MRAGDVKDGWEQESDKKENRKDAPDKRNRQTAGVRPHREETNDLQLRKGVCEEKGWKRR